MDANATRAKASVIKRRNGSFQGRNIWTALHSHTHYSPSTSIRCRFAQFIAQVGTSLPLASQSYSSDPFMNLLMNIPLLFKGTRSENRFSDVHSHVASLTGSSGCFSNSSQTFPSTFSRHCQAARIIENPTL
jgi:hypothetical protein